MSTKIKIEIASNDDASQISNLIQANFRNDPLYKNYEKDVLDSYIETNSTPKILKYINDINSRVFIIKKNGLVIGAVVLRLYPMLDANGHWRIRRLHVHPEYRNLHIAVKLLKYSENFVREEGHNIIYAEATPEVQNFLTKNGWQGELISKEVSYHNDNMQSKSVLVSRFQANKILDQTNNCI